MKREQFEKALEVNKELGRFKKHKEDLEKSQIQFGGCLIFHYNDHYPKVSLIGELYEETTSFQSIWIIWKQRFVILKKSLMSYKQTGCVIF